MVIPARDSMQNSPMKQLCLGMLLVMTASSTASAKDCDRGCLKGLITTYVGAMLAHKTDSLPLAANVRFTEDMKELEVGEGVWKDVTRTGGFRQDYLDIRTARRVTREK